MPSMEAGRPRGTGVSPAAGPALPSAAALHTGAARAQKQGLETRAAPPRGTMASVPTRLPQDSPF